MIAEDEAALLAELRAISDRSVRLIHQRKRHTSPRTAMPCIQDRKDHLGPKESMENDINPDDDLSGRFLDDTPEDSHLNQYWYSRTTIQTLCQAVVEGLESTNTKRAAFLSTPSLYFSLPPEIRKQCVLLDYDRTWSSDPGFVFYDFNNPKSLSSALRSEFDMVIIDPPFIAEGVWSNYTETATFLLKGDPKERSNGSLVIGTTVLENAPFMRSLLGVEPVNFLPSIPNLVYQYSVFTNFVSEALSGANPEISIDPGTSMPKT